MKTSLKWIPHGQKLREAVSYEHLRPSFQHTRTHRHTKIWTEEKDDVLSPTVQLLKVCYSSKDSWLDEINSRGVTSLSSATSRTSLRLLLIINIVGSTSFFAKKKKKEEEEVQCLERIWQNGSAYWKKWKLPWGKVRINFLSLLHLATARHVKVQFLSRLFWFCFGFEAGLVSWRYGCRINSWGRWKNRSWLYSGQNDRHVVHRVPCTNICFTVSVCRNR